MKYTNKNQQFPPKRQSHPHPLSDSESSEDLDSDSSDPQAEQLMNTEMQRIKQELKSIPYELILKQSKAMNESTNSNKTPAIVKKQGKKIKKNFIRQEEKHNKNETVEVSIHQKPKKKAPVLFQPSRKKGIDPRFQKYAGHYNQDLAMKSFDFIPKLQQAQIEQLKSKLKNPSKRNKLSPHEKQVLSKQYNRITSDYKRTELLQLQRQTKAELKQRHGDNYYIGKKQMKHQFQRKKLENMGEGERDKKMKEKWSKIRRNQYGQRRKTLHFKPK